jgi:hypothetical protein
MAIIIALGIALAVVGYITAPFLLMPGRMRPEPKAQPSPELQDLLAEKETIYAAIQELEFDYKSGKLSVEDQAGLRARQEERAARILQQIDALQRPPTAKARKR